MTRFSAFSGAVVIVAVLTTLCVATQLSIIQGDLRLRVTSALRAQDLENLEVTLVGRDLILGGVLLAEEDRSRSLEVARVYGVRTVEDRLRGVELEDLWLRIQVSEDGDVAIRGWIDDRKGMESLQWALESRFRSGLVDEDLDIARIRTPSLLLEGAWAALPWLAELSPGLLEITSERLLLAGRTARHDVIEMVGPAMDGNFSGVSKIEVELDQDLAESNTGETSYDELLANALHGSASSLEDSLSLQECRSRVGDFLASEDLAFEKWSPRLDSASAPILLDLALLLNRCPEGAVRITGLADRESYHDVNLILGKERARSVKAWLGALGVAADRMTIEGSDRGAQRTGSRVVRAIELELEGIAP